MDKLQELLKRTWLVIVIIIIITLLAVIGIPLLINWLFSQPALWSSFAVNWEVKDALAYYGSALGFIGTVALGIITVYQTKKAHNQTERANSQTEKANKLAEDALAQTQKANELAAKMQKLEESRFLSMVSVENACFQIEKRTRVDSGCLPFLIPDTPHFFTIDFTDEAVQNECYLIDVKIRNSSDYHIGILQVVVDHAESVWRRGPRRNGLAPNGLMTTRIIIPRTNRKTVGDYGLQIHFYFTNVFGYTTHLTLAIKDITNADGKHTYNYDIEKETEEVF